MITYKTTEQLRQENLSDALTFLKDAIRQIKEGLETKGRATLGQLAYLEKTIENYKEERGIK